MAGKHANPKPRNAALAVAVGGGVALTIAGAGAGTTSLGDPDAQRGGGVRIRRVPATVAGAQINTAVKIARAESALNTNAHNPNGEDSRGLRQINVAAHGSPWGNLDDPLTNAGTNWTPWTTYVADTHHGRTGVTTPPTPKPSATATYVVRSGDTLWGIAPGRDWRALYERNRYVVGDNPDLIFPGQVLRLR